MAENTVVPLSRRFSRQITHFDCNEDCGKNLKIISIIGKSTSVALLCLNVIIPIIMDEKTESSPLSDPALIVGNALVSIFLIHNTCVVSMDHKATQPMIVYVVTQGIKITLMSFTIAYVHTTVNRPLENANQFSTWGIELKEMFDKGDMAILVPASLYVIITVIDCSTYIFVFMYLMNHLHERFSDNLLQL